MWILTNKITSLGHGSITPCPASTAVVPAKDNTVVRRALPRKTRVSLQQCSTAELLKDEDNHHSEGFWSEFFLLKPDKVSFQKRLDAVSADGLLHFQVR